MQQPEAEGKGLLQSQPQRPHLPPNGEQAASCQPCPPGIVDGLRWPEESQSEISSPEETYGTPEVVPSQCTTHGELRNWDLGGA